MWLLVPASLTTSLRGLRDVLHWLPVLQRIDLQFKGIALTTLLTVYAVLVHRISGTSAFQWPTSL